MLSRCSKYAGTEQSGDTGISRLRTPPHCVQQKRITRARVSWSSSCTKYACLIGRIFTRSLYWGRNGVGSNKHLPLILRHNTLAHHDSYLNPLRGRRCHGCKEPRLITLQTAHNLGAIQFRAQFITFDYVPPVRAVWNHPTGGPVSLLLPILNSLFGTGFHCSGTTRPSIPAMLRRAAAGRTWDGRMWISPPNGRPTRAATLTG